MAFAIFYNMDDLTDLADRVQDSRITGQDRQEGGIYWNGGLSGWATAPRAPFEHPRYENDPDTRIIVIEGATLESFRTYLYRLAALIPRNGNDAGLQFLEAVADSLATRWFAVEPWPWVGPPDSPWDGFPRLPAPLQEGS